MPSSWTVLPKDLTDGSAMPALAVPMTLGSVFGQMETEVPAIRRSWKCGVRRFQPRVANILVEEGTSGRRVSKSVRRRGKVWEMQNLRRAVARLYVCR